MHLPNLSITIQISLLKIHGCHPPSEHPFDQHFLPSLNVVLPKVLEKLSRDDSTRDHPTYGKNTAELRREAFIPIKDTVEGINKAQFLNLPQEHSPSDDIHHKK